MRKTKVKKKLADAAGRLGSAKENYHTPPSYRNFPARQVFIRKIRTANQTAKQISNRVNYGNNRTARGCPNRQTFEAMKQARIQNAE